MTFKKKHNNQIIFNDFSFVEVHIFSNLKWNLWKKKVTYKKSEKYLDRIINDSLYTNQNTNHLFS